MVGKAERVKERVGKDSREPGDLGVEAYLY